MPSTKRTRPRQKRHDNSPDLVNFLWAVVTLPFPFVNIQGADRGEAPFVRGHVGSGEGVCAGPRPEPGPLFMVPPQDRVAHRLLALGPGCGEFIGIIADDQLLPLVVGGHSVQRGLALGEGGVPAVAVIPVLHTIASPVADIARRPDSVMKEHTPLIT
jgi:hypothetical protein